MASSWRNSLKKSLFSASDSEESEIVFTVDSPEPETENVRLRKVSPVDRRRSLAPDSATMSRRSSFQDLEQLARRALKSISTSSNYDEDEESVDESGSDDSATILAKSTLTLFSNCNALDDSTAEGRKLLKFKTDLDDLADILTCVEDQNEKRRLICLALQELKSLRTAATLNSHFIVLSSVVDVNLPAMTYESLGKH